MNINCLVCVYCVLQYDLAQIYINKYYKEYVRKIYVCRMYDVYYMFIVYVLFMNIYTSMYANACFI